MVKGRRRIRLENGDGERTLDLGWGTGLGEKGGFIV